MHSLTNLKISLKLQVTSLKNFYFVLIVTVLNFLILM